MGPVFKSIDEAWGRARQEQNPGKDRDQQDRTVVPKRLAVLEDWSQVALEIVLQDEDADKIGIAQRAQNVPGQRRHAEYGDDQWMQETKWRAPQAGERGPYQSRAARKDHGGWAFREHGSSEKKSERNTQNRPGPRLLQYFAGDCH